MNGLERAVVEVDNRVVGDVVDPGRPEPAVFIYRQGTESSAAVSVTMPVSEQAYSWEGLHPIFAQNLPEGYLGDMIRKHVAKLYGTGDLTVLAALGRHQVGRVVVSDPELAEGAELDTGESLAQLLSADDDSLFEELVEKYALRSGISGVQPKVLVPSRFDEKSALRTEGYIVKSWGDDYPQLAANEYFCMSLARDFGLPVPDFYLSENARLFVMSRFDRQAGGQWMGFEDACVLHGLLPEDKYSGSYERLAKTFSVYLSPNHRRHGMRWLFKSVLVSWAVQNGDAHLKNFGLLYQHPFGERWLAPTYDIVSTTPYLRNDVPALTLAGRKTWWPVAYLERFGQQSCGLTAKEAKAEMHQLAECLGSVSANIEVYCSSNPEFSDIGSLMVSVFRESSRKLAEAWTM